MDIKETRLNGYGETYVSIELAKLLKTKGFNWWCRSAYTEYKDGEIELLNDHFHVNDSESDLSNTNFTIYGRPELHIVLKWLRDCYNIYINIHIHNDGYSFNIQKINGKYGTELLFSSILTSINTKEYYNTYENSLEIALFESLKSL